MHSMEWGALRKIKSLGLNWPNGEIQTPRIRFPTRGFSIIAKYRKITIGSLVCLCVYVKLHIFVEAPTLCWSLFWKWPGYRGNQQQNICYRHSNGECDFIHSLEKVKLYYQSIDYHHHWWLGPSGEGFRKVWRSPLGIPKEAYFIQLDQS